MKLNVVKPLLRAGNLGKVSGIMLEGFLEQSIKKSLSLLERNQKPTLLDCGCSEGDLTIKVANKIRAYEVYGIDIHEESVFIFTLFIVFRSVFEDTFSHVQRVRVDEFPSLPQ